MPDVRDVITKGGDVIIENKTTGNTIIAKCDLTDRMKEIILAGGLLNYTKEKNNG